MSTTALSEAAVADHVLLAKRKLRLAWYEEELVKRWRSFANLYLELQRDALQPYLATHPTLEAYCMERFGLTDRRMQQLAAGETMKQLLAAEFPEVSDMNERAMREIKAVPAESRSEVMRVVTTSPGRITARKIKLVRAVIIDQQPEPAALAPAACCPTCGKPI